MTEGDKPFTSAGNLKRAYSGRNGAQVLHKVWNF